MHCYTLDERLAVVPSEASTRGRNRGGTPDNPGASARQQYIKGLPLDGPLQR